MPSQRFSVFVTLSLSVGLCWLSSGCRSTTPSSKLENRVDLPIPAHTQPLSASPSAPSEMSPATIKLTARSVISIAFNQQPDIKSSYEHFKAEQARYDFFYASNDALTPRFKGSNEFYESRTLDNDTGQRLGQRDREHVIEVGLDKQFFDTTELSIATGIETVTEDGGIGNQPYVSASMRYPLWESREKLERTSEDIFRRNELDDAQLNYIKQVRSRLQRALIYFYTVVKGQTRVASSESWRDDLLELEQQLDRITDHDLTTDRRRIAAELVRVNSEIRNHTGRLEVDLARLKYFCGLPYKTKLEISRAPFNPFADAAHEQLRLASIDTDPEIATLRNSLRNAETQLDLARRGKWDVALLLDGQGNLRGHGVESGNTDWSISAGLEVSAIDGRVTNSLQRQARANIARFKHAIAARESLIYADTLEPLVRIDTLGASRDALTKNLRRFRLDYEIGLQEYLAGKLNIDDLLKRRETIYEQEEEIAELAMLVGANVAELCSATGKFFELLEQPPG